jgi:TRAP-type mannitol/chloroaromatic compound transport system substrate-binding protein
LAEATQTNATALMTLFQTSSMKIESFPEPVLTDALNATRSLMKAISDRDNLSHRIVASYTQAQLQLRGWSWLSADMTAQLARLTRL